MTATAVPNTVEEAGTVMAACAADGRNLRVRGGATKYDWGRAVPAPGLELSTAALSGIIEHNAGDLTVAVRAGTTLAEIQAVVGAAGQMLAFDPPDPGARATIGGVLATADSGPFRHRYGAVRDLVLGITVVLSDGTVARAGGRVIKNVAGYDLAKLFCGSFGTLGLVAELAFRLHPRPPVSATALARSSDPAVLGRAAAAVARVPLEAEALDVSWDGTTGAVLVRLASRDPRPRLARARALLAGVGADVDPADDPDVDPDVDPADDGLLWRTQRDGQRAAPGGLALRIAAVPTRLPELCAAATAVGASLVGRAALGSFFLTLPPAGDDDLVGAVDELRARFAPHPMVVTDAPVGVRAKVDPWGASGAEGLMRRVKERFDPAGVCAPGSFLAGI